MKNITLPSYAKLNLALKIVGKRPDGFHELVTLFERIDLHDDITFKTSPQKSFSIACDDKRVPCDKRNLIWKAAQVLAEGENVPMAANIIVKKRIPVAAGLAGGSSNAATALMGLNQLWDLKLSRDKLITYANKLGSDITFFLYDVPFAIGTGRGEVIKPLKLKAKLDHFVVVPKAPLLTKDVYGAFKLAELTNRDDDVNIVLRCLETFDLSTVADKIFNDLETPILKLKPHLAKLKARVARADKNVLGCCFSGSGPSIFAVMATHKDAQRMKKIFARLYSQVFAVRTQ